MWWHFSGLRGRTPVCCHITGWHGLWQQMLSDSLEAGSMKNSPAVVPVSWYHHLIDLAHPTLLQVHLGPQEPLMLADLPRHAEVNIHTVSGPRGRSDCKTRGQAGRSLFLTAHFPGCTREQPASGLAMVVAWHYGSSPDLVFAKPRNPSHYLQSIVNMSLSSDSPLRRASPPSFFTDSSTHIQSHYHLFPFPSFAPPKHPNHKW